MRILQCLFIFTVFIPITVSLYYPYGYMWVGPYQVVPVLYVRDVEWPEASYSITTRSRHVSFWLFRLFQCLSKQLDPSG
ncbi:hypothetical protein DPX16_2092 [Anabarilius grahami]|uniref:Uncharacterized protein n=1 Tax=Anabarilius grahami TaxID=495550 RepID=A0A3N0Y118_ANAGA|nr:hypothetical protein DPX16_2092 [Anabarilius grahami]